MKSFKKYIEHNKVDWYNLSEKEQLKIIKKDPDKIFYIPNPSEKVQLFFLKIKEKFEPENIAISLIKNPCKKAQIHAVKKHIWNIFYIKKPDPNVVLYCIINKPELLKDQEHYIGRKLPQDYFKHLDYEIQKELIEYNPMFVLHIKNLDPRLKNHLNKIADKTGLF